MFHLFIRPRELASERKSRILILQNRAAFKKHVQKTSAKTIDNPSKIRYNTEALRVDPLAQSVEHLTFNQGVRSSNLRWITKRKLLIYNGFRFFHARNIFLLRKNNLELVFIWSLFPSKTAFLTYKTTRSGQPPAWSFFVTLFSDLAKEAPAAFRLPLRLRT